MPRALQQHPTDPTALVVPLTRGLVAVIDAEDADIVGAYSWYAQATQKGGPFYAARSITPAPGRRKIVYLHHVLSGVPDDAHPRIDHVDRDTLNDRRSNLRRSTYSQNQANRGIPQNNASGFKGVSWHAVTGEWQVHIRFKRRVTRLGEYGDRRLAALIYDRAARQIHGEFAACNLPEVV